MFTGRLLTALAAEHALGHIGGEVPIIASALATVESLFPYAGEEPAKAGYLIRNNSADSNDFVPGSSTSANFLVDPATRRYLSCVPHRDPRHVPNRTHETLERLLSPEQRAEYDEDREQYFGRIRFQEFSQDELIGYCAALSVLHDLVTDPGVRGQVATQAARLGDYLAENAYLLVRPEGGLCAQGPAGMLPSLETPLSALFERIVGRDFRARAKFANAMHHAGYWAVLDAPVSKEAALLAVGGPALAGAIGPLIAGLVPGLGGEAAVLGTLLGAVADLTSVMALPPSVRKALPFAVAAAPRAVALNRHLEVFDLAYNEATAPVLASILDEIPAQLRFDVVLDILARLSGDQGRYARGFLPYIGVTGLAEPDGPVGRGYVRVMEIYRAAEAVAGTQEIRYDLLGSAFASAVALLLGAPVEEEGRFVRILEHHSDELRAAPDGLLIDYWAPDQGDGAYEKLDPGLDLLAGLALGWLYARRRADKGNPVTTPGFPVPPPVGHEWPAVTVPDAVVADDAVIRTTLGNPTPGHDVEVFGPDVPQERSRPTAPDVPDIHWQEQAERRIVKVRDTDGDVATGVRLGWGDTYEVQAHGRITAPEVLAGQSGPEGWNVLVDDARFALHIGIDPQRARKYCLLGRLGGYFFVGEDRPREQYLAERSRELFLRVNNDDHTRGSGSGAFEATITVYRDPPPWTELVQIIGIQSTFELGPVAWLADAYANNDVSRVNELLAGGTGVVGNITVANRGALDEGEIVAIAPKLAGKPVNIPQCSFWTSSRVIDPHRHEAALMAGLSTAALRFGQSQPIARAINDFPETPTPHRLFLVFE